MNVALPTVAASLAVQPQRRALRTLAFVLAAGVATQALFWHAPIGLNFWLWDLALVAGQIAVYRRSAMTPAARGAVVAAVLLGFAPVRFESTWAMVVAFPSTLAVLSVLPALLEDRLTLAELAGLPWRLLRSVAVAPRAVGDAVKLPARAVAEAEGTGGTVFGVGLGLLVGLPTAGIFIGLLATDDAFAHALGALRDKLGDAASFAFASAISAAGYLVGDRVHARTRRREPEVAPREEVFPYRTPPWAEAKAPDRRRISILAWGMVVAQVAAVFALFVAVNLRHLFGGHALVHAAGAPTYSAYLHAGFGELLFAATLSVCLVALGHALLARGAAGAVPGGAVIAGLESALLLLTGVTLASCWQRLGIYEDAYGASELRLGVAFIELGVLCTLVLTLAKVWARRWRGYGGSLVALAAGVAVVASLFNADGYVAQSNLDRAAAGRALDVDYLRRLSRDAAVVLDHPYVKRDPVLASTLAESLCASHGTGWRSHRGLTRCAR
ncbi:MAG TPA: DUF4173 domain-containing protein [Polyangiaceae bacterium]|jgi:hypothetical protein